jgi:hypothetical protein
MVDVRVRATASRWESDDQPGWVEASVLDAHGKKHRIVEKEPTLFSQAEEVTADSPFPFEFWIDAEMESIDGEDVSVSLSHGVDTIDGQGV